MRRLLRRARLFLLVLLLEAFFRVLSLTWRVRLVNVPPVDRRARGGKPVIYAFWHQRMLAFIKTHRRQAVHVLISRHGDGELIARLIERFGFRTARGSSTRGGAEGLRGMIEAARGGYDCAITPDGPKGPRHVLKPGIVGLAAATGLPIVCGGYGTNRAWRFRSWDGFILPKPFARIVICAAQPTYVDAGAGSGGGEAAAALLERERARVEGLLRDVTAEADELAGTPPAPPSPARMGKPVAASAASAANNLVGPIEHGPRLVTSTNLGPRHA